jgi:hypothetical protein
LAAVAVSATVSVTGFFSSVAGASTAGFSVALTSSAILSVICVEFWLVVVIDVAS